MAGIDPLVWKNYNQETGQGDPSTPLTAETLNQWTSDIVLVSDTAEAAAIAAQEAAAAATAAAQDAADVAANVARASAHDRLSTFGDSLTDGGDSGVLWPESDTWPVKLATHLGTVDVTNKGFSGATVSELLLRVGADKPRLTVAGGVIPSSDTVSVATLADLGVPASRVFGIDGTAGPFARNRVNLLKNPGPGVDSGWAVSGGTGGVATRAHYAAGGVDGAPYVEATWTTAPTGGGRTVALDVTGDPGQVIAGERYTASAWVRSSTNRSVGIDIGWYGASYITQTAGSSTTLTPGVWTRLSVTAVAPAGATRAALTASARANPAVGETLAASRALLEAAPSMRTWFDGASVGATWSGAANASTSSRTDFVGITSRLSRASGGALSLTTYGYEPDTTVTGPVTFTAATQGGASDTATVWIGRNDLTYDITGPDATVADHIVGGVQRLVEWLTPQVKNVMIFGLFAQPNEPSGSARHATITEVNDRLRALFPGKFLSVHEYLRDHALADMGVTPTTDDLADIANDTVPRSTLAADGGHISKATATVIATHFVAPYLQAKGWV